MQINKLPFVGPMLFLKFSILMAIVLSLTVVKPMAMAAHNVSKKACSFIMKTDCSQHC